MRLPLYNRIPMKGLEQNEGSDVRTMILVAKEAPPVRAAARVIDEQDQESEPKR